MYIELDFQDKKYRAMLERLAAPVNTRHVLMAIGEALKPINQDRHRRAVDPDEKPWKPLAASTRALNESPWMLRKTGHMLSLHYQVQGKQLRIGADDWKGAFHQFGAKPYRIAPKNAPALAFGRSIGGKKREFVRMWANHPGLPARPTTVRSDTSPLNTRCIPSVVSSSSAPSSATPAQRPVMRSTSPSSMRTA